jgi:26S proteasome regulatory subunit N7
MQTDTSAAAIEAQVHANEKASRERLAFAQKVFRLSLNDELVPEKAALHADIIKEIESHSMKKLYEHLTTTYGWSRDGGLLERMSATITDKVSKFDAAVVEAREKFGDVEVLDRQREKAEWLASTGDRDASIKAYEDMNSKALSTGQKIDIAMSQARSALEHAEWTVAREKITEAKDLNEKGGDWDRRNRLKAYEGLQCIATRDFKQAAALLLDTVATFTAAELLEYKDFIFYTVITSLQSLDRVALKKRVIDSPDVLSVIDEIPFLTELLNSFYECRYRDFLKALTDIYPSVVRDRYISRHAPFYLREMRLAAYVQFLESYKSVTLSGMARTFGISESFLDAELARFISAGRINAKIDSVAGIIETTRPDAKNAQYHTLIKQGDGLLNKIQKLSRIVAM